MEGFLSDKTVPQKQRQDLATEWAVQALTLGALLGDKDRGRPSNCIVQPIDDDQYQLVHYDFEDARFYAAGQPFILDEIAGRVLGHYFESNGALLSRGRVLDRMAEAQQALLDNKAKMAPGYFDRYQEQLKTAGPCLEKISHKRYGFTV